MSRKEQFQDKPTNPSELTIQWAGGNDAGHFKTYDPEVKEKISLKPFSFVVLKEKNCLDGFLAAKNSGAWSNEVSNLKAEEMTVMYKDNGDFKVFKSGMYADIVEEMKSNGVKYHKVIYAMVTDSPDIATGVICRILLKGAGASAWFSLSAEDKKGTITLTGAEDGQTGAVRYKIPVFEASEVTAEADTLAEVAYDKVEAYLQSRAEARPAPVQEASEPETDDSLPF
jgi:hypothetical protein